MKENAMLVTKTETTETVFDVAKFCKRFLNGKVQKNDYCILSSILKKYRWELFKTFAGYRSIRNGNGNFLYVELIECGTKIPATTIMQKILQLENNGELQVDIT